MLKLTIEQQAFLAWFFIEVQLTNPDSISEYIDNLEELTAQEIGKYFFKKCNLIHEVQ